MLRRKARAAATAVTGAAVALATTGMLFAPSANAVAGGHPVADPQAAPWMVSLAKKGSEPLQQRTLCGGTLIAPDRVLTAGHCLDKSDPTHLEVRVGSTDLAAHPGRVVPVRGWSVRPGFRTFPLRNDPKFTDASATEDATVIILDRPVRDVAPMPLAAHRPVPGSPVELYGHGFTHEGVDPHKPILPNELNEGDMRIIDHRSCAQQASNFVVDGRSMVCADTPQPDPMTSVCKGDSGGPLIADTRGRAEQVGVVSFAAGSGNTCGVPDGFTDMARLRSWALSPTLPLAPSTDQDPRVTGMVKVGETVQCDLPRWKGNLLARHEISWYTAEKPVNGLVPLYPVDGATAPSFTITDKQAHKALMCAVDSQSAGGSVHQESPITKPVAP